MLPFNRWASLEQLTGEPLEEGSHQPCRARTDQQQDLNSPHPRMWEDEQVFVFPEELVSAAIHGLMFGLLVDACC